MQSKIKGARRKTRLHRRLFSQKVYSWDYTTGWPEYWDLILEPIPELPQKSQMSPTSCIREQLTFPHTWACVSPCSSLSHYVSPGEPCHIWNLSFTGAWKVQFLPSQSQKCTEACQKKVRIELKQANPKYLPHILYNLLAIFSFCLTTGRFSKSLHIDLCDG